MANTKDKKTSEIKETTEKTTQELLDELKALKEENSKLAKKNESLTSENEKLNSEKANSSQAEASTNVQKTDVDCNGKTFNLKNDGGDELRRRGLSEKAVQNELELRKPVPIYIPRQEFKSDDVRIMDPLRGTPLVIKRGETVEVPGYIAAALSRSDNADILTRDIMDRKAEDFENDRKKFGH